ncbi:MAG: substrate-binding domain-containing protein [Bacillota bacterium]
MRLVRYVCIFILLVLLSACQQKNNTLILVTTTSVENSGLLEYLLPEFEEAYDIDVNVVAVGTGAALELGERGQADVLLVHDLNRELEFVEAGFGEKRADLMYNYFIYVGPEPIEHDGTLVDFLQNLHQNHQFLSRGDQSGTHTKELTLWDSLSLSVSFDDSWYHESGQGMESTLSMASIKGYYTLTDQGTYLSVRPNLNLEIVFSEEDALLNPYGIIKVSETLHNRDADNAELLYQWFINENTKDRIREFKINQDQLFYMYD